jgi:hypothetical protein
VVDVAPVAGAAPAGAAVFSRGVGVDGVGRAGAELDDEILPAKVLEYVLERCPCTSRSALQENCFAVQTTTKACHCIVGFLKYTTMKHTFFATPGSSEDHVCFEDRWMVASWCDE